MSTLQTRIEQIEVNLQSMKDVVDLLIEEVGQERVFDRDPNDGAAVLLATYNVSASYSASGACTMTVVEVLP